MKKRSFIALLLALALLLCACAGNSQSKTETTEEQKKANPPQEVKNSEEGNDTEGSEESKDPESSEDVILENQLCINSANYTLDSDMVTYLYLSDLHYFDSNYGSYLAYYAPSQQAPDMMVSLDTQYYDTGEESGNEQTWHDYFFTMTIDTAKTYLCYAEEGLAAGFEYSEQESDVTQYIDSMKSSAQQESLTLDEYLAKYFGSNINEEVIRKALNIYFYGIGYLESIQGEKEASVTDEELEALKPEDTEDEITKDVGHILITPDLYGSDEAALEMAEKILDDFRNGDATIEYFEELSNNYTADSNCFYYNVKQGDMVQEFNDWLFDESRQVGDTDIVKTTYGYHIMYFVGDGEPSWKATARETLVQEYMDAFTAELNEKYSSSIIVQQDVLDAIPDHFPATAADAETQE